MGEGKGNQYMSRKSNRISIILLKLISKPKVLPLRRVNEVQVRHVLVCFWVIAAVDFSVYQRVTHRLKDGDPCLLRLTAYFTLENVVVFHVLQKVKS